MKQILLVVLCALLGGCASGVPVPITDDGSRPTGSAALPQAADFDGIGDLARSGSTRVIWVHGMCTHDADWARERSNLLVATLGSADAKEPEVIDHPGGAQTAQLRTQVNGYPLEVDFLVWSPLTADLKHQLDFDRPTANGGEFPYSRAKLNGQLKTGLMNDCLIDAVAYAGPNGDSIRSFMRDEVCRALGGVARSGSCEIRDSTPPAATVFVAESLGSKMLFDAVRSIYRENERRGTVANLNAQLGSVQLIFLLANQVPILDAADEEVGDRHALIAGGGENGDSSLGEVLRLLEPARRMTSALAARELPSLHVVAFTDPNDLLSYRLDARRLGVDRLQVANVIVSNAPVYFGYVERPDHAHCGYKWNPYVIGTLVEGFAHGTVAKADIRLEEVCGLAG